MSNCLCFATLNNLGAATAIQLPPGTSAVVVQKFTTASAVSDAVYIPVSGNPNHPLSIANIQGTLVQWWAIHPDHVTLEAAGAPPAGPTIDCAPAMQNVLNYLAAVGRARLQLWERDYFLSNAGTLLQSNPLTDPVLYFSVIGCGRGVSRLLIPYAQSPVKPLGAFSITFSLNQSEFLAQDFSVIATGATATGSGCGTAMLVNFSGTLSGAAPTDHRAVIVTHVHIGNDGVETDNVAWSYFPKGLDLTGAPRPLVSGVTFVGCTGSGTSSYDDNSPRYLVQAHLILNECYSPFVTDCNIWAATLGVSAQSTTNVQGFVMSGTHMEAVRTGLLHSHANYGVNPGGTLANNNVQFRDVGFDLANISKWRAAGNQFRNEGPGEQPAICYDMRFQAAQSVMLTGNQFVTASNTFRVNILIDADTVVNGANFGSHFLIDSHQFGEELPLGSTFGTSGIKITLSAKDIQIGATNQFVGDYTGLLVDDASGSAVTSTGFPGVPGTTPVPAIVAPSGNNMIGPTELGSDAAPWYASFSLGHYLPPPVSAPGNPAMNTWVIYTDPFDKKLYAKFHSGTTVPLAAP